MKTVKKSFSLWIIYIAALLFVAVGTDCPNLIRPLANAEAATPRVAKRGDSPASQRRAIEKPLTDRAPDFTLLSLQDDQVTLSQIKKGKGVVLVFFATWCVNCVKEMQEIGHFAEIAEKENTLVLGINYKQKKEIVDRFIKSEQIKFKILLDMEGKVTIEKYGIRGIPHIIGINAKDEIIFRGVALPDKRDEFIKKLKQGL